MTFWETIERGEYVMFALALLLLLIICIWWVRSVKLGKERKSIAPLMHRVRDQIVEGDIENARQLCEATGSPGAKIVAAGIHRIGKPMEEVRGGINMASQIEKEKMNKGELWLRAIAVISPLLGLGGTLVGVIDRLRDLGEAGPAVDLASLCGSIAPTIVTTVAGLGVGIFAIVALTCLNARIESSRRSLDELGLEFIDLLNEPS